MVVQFIKSHNEFAYFPGDNANLAPEQAQKLIESGHVILFPGVQETESEQPENKKKYRHK